MALSARVLPQFRHGGVAHYLQSHEVSPRSRTPVMRTKVYRRHIPEAFIWYLFYGLAKGLVAMEQGPFNEPGDPTGAFMAHRDMKPTNSESLRLATLDMFHTDSTLSFPRLPIS